VPASAPEAPPGSGTEGPPPVRAGSDRSEGGPDETGRNRTDSGGRRRVRFPDEPARIESRIVPRDSLLPGDLLPGPAIVEQDDTTTLVPPGWAAITGGDGSMTLAPEPDPDSA